MESVDSDLVIAGTRNEKLLFNKQIKVKQLHTIGEDLLAPLSPLRELQRMLMSCSFSPLTLLTAPYHSCVPMLQS